MRVKDSFQIRQIGTRLKKLGTFRVEASRSSLLRGSAILLIFVIAFTVRMLPIRWIPTPWNPEQYYLSEFDPYFQYRITKHIAENGLLSWATEDGKPWHDYMSWYPSGRDIATTAFPGLPMTTASAYMILKALSVPIDLVQFCLIFPAIMGAVTCLAIYFLGRDMGGEAVGLFSAFFLALNSSHISRTSLGFFDDETIGVFGIILFTLLFLRAIEKERPLKEGIAYAVGAGLSLGYLSASWGATRYPLDMTVLFVFVLLLIRRYSSRLFLSYGVSFGLALLIAASVPRLGLAFLWEVSVLPAYGVLLLMCGFEIHGRLKTQKMRILALVVFVVLVLAAVSSLWFLGYFRTLGSKYIAVLNPFERASSPLIESVAEHKPSAWGIFYYDFGVLAFLIPIGLFFAIQMGTTGSMFLSIFTLTSIYFASSMVRLTLVMAPAVCLVSALGVVRLVKPFAVLLRESPMAPKRKAPFGTRLGKEFGAGFLIVIFILFTLTYVTGTDFSAQTSRHPRVFEQAYSPTTIAAASMGFRPTDTVTDWVNALIWMRENLPPSPPWQPPPGSNKRPTVVASWWDYGYWITVIANRTSLADNGTINSTQIVQIARMFMSPEDEAIEMLKKYNVTHVLVFTTVNSQGQDYPWGEAGKFIWMIKIGGLNESKFGDYNQQGAWEWSDYGKNTTLYKMMTYGKAMRLPNAQLATQQYYELYDQWGHFTEHFIFLDEYPKGQPVSGVYALILIYEVRY